MERRGKKHGKKPRNSAHAWTQGNCLFFSFVFLHSVTLLLSTSLFFSPQSWLFFSCMIVIHMGKGQHGICVRALWVTRRWRAEALCILAVCRATLMSLIYGHFVWLGRKKWESIWKALSLSPVKSFSPNWLPPCCQNWSLFWCTMVC